MDGDVEAGETTALIPTTYKGVVGYSNTRNNGNNDNHAPTDEEVAELVLKMFMANWKYSSDLSRYPKTNPKLPPVVRFKRHRNFYIFEINQFRHWWKTSR
jgi:hypothetical protein